MRRSILFLSLVAATIAVAACSTNAPTQAKQPAVRKDVGTDSFPSTTCRSGWQSSSGRCL